jgi:hypothetical protein
LVIAEDENTLAAAIQAVYRAAALVELHPDMPGGSHQATVELNAARDARCRRSVMGENSKIEWTDHTFNPWIGCTKVSPACDPCYAETLAKRYGWVKWGPGEARKLTSAANWR